jgi:hypothetical protein
LSENKVKDRHRGDLNRNRFINAKQNKIRIKVHSSGRRVAKLNNHKTLHFYWGQSCVSLTFGDWIMCHQLLSYWRGLGLGWSNQGCKEGKPAYNRDICMLMFIATLFTIAKLWN